ncbi:hypothetical protein ACGFLS_07840 [Streptomyces abikoensis]|uniref:hypothetical protein n=1 Tax=Streptomyces abikoensis TaxID=97398 RepID=UPI003717E899
MSPSSARPVQPVAVEAQALLPMIWGDPEHMPEQLALFAVRRFGPRAAAAVERRRERAPGAGPDELNAGIISHGTRVTIAEGAVVGGPFVVLVPLSFVAALLARAQMVLELAAVAGHAPESERRVAELLLLQDVYASLDEANKALAHAERHPPGGAGRVPRRTRWRLILKMAALLGLIGGEKRSRARQALSVVSFSGLFLIGLALPWIWMPVLAVFYQQATSRLGTKAATFYAQDPAAARRHRRWTHRGLKAPGIASVLRFVALALLPVATAGAAILAEARIAGGPWGTALIVLCAVSLVTAAIWYGRRWAGARPRSRHKPPRRG